MPNVEPANRFGSIHYIFDSSDHPSSDPTEAQDKAIQRLKGFDPENDHLCWSNYGDPTGMWIVMHLLGSMGATKVKVLCWSRGKSAGEGMTNENGYYFSVEIDASRFRI